VNSKIRAGLITVVVMIHGFVAAPLPRSISAHDMRGDVAAEELDRWSEILGSVGIEATPDEVADLALKTGRVIVKWRNAIVTPIRPALRLTGTGQGWGLFTYPDTRPRRLIMRGRTANGDWQLLYRTLDTEHDWNAELWRHRRLRAPTDTLSRKTRPGGVYKNFVDYAAARAFEDFPELQAFQVSFERSHSTRPGRKSAPTTTVHVEVRKR